MKHRTVTILLGSVFLSASLLAACYFPAWQNCHNLCVGDPYPTRCFVCGATLFNSVVIDVSSRDYHLDDGASGYTALTECKECKVTVSSGTCSSCGSFTAQILLFEKNEYLWGDCCYQGG